MSLYSSAPVRLALVRPMPSSFSRALTQHAPPAPIDLPLAQKQHENYTNLVRQHVGRLIDIPGDETCPDCCFIEDTAIIMDNTVIMTRIGHPSRSQESIAVLAALEQLAAAGMPLAIHNLCAPATLDGGDVLQMGGTLFVGLSQRSNTAAIQQLRALLYTPVVEVPVSGALHLKSMLSAIDDSTLLIADQPSARAMGAHILASLPTGARMVVVPDTIAANVLRLGNVVVVQAGFPRSEAILGELCREKGLTMITLCMSELIKADGALTCCSLIMP